MEHKFYPLSVITRRINDLLQPAILKKFWVKAEVSSGREKGGSFFCELTEADANGKVIAKISCNIWAQDLASIRRVFKTKGLDLVLADGSVVGFLCSLQYSHQHGLSLRVFDADPSLALGEMELRKREIIERLQKEGLFQPNKERFLPLLPLRIGLITSNGSAAYNDFIKTLTMSGFGFKVYLADALMQGNQTEQSVLKAMGVLERCYVEVVVIVRGGGSKTDLYHLDNEAIARRIAAYPLPVMVGVGHEIDRSVLDFVAYQEFKTPTAVAEDLVARFVQMRRQLEDSGGKILSVWTHRLKAAWTELERDTTGLRQGTRKLLDVTSAGLRDRAHSLRHEVLGRIRTEQAHVENRKGLLRSRPVALVQRHVDRLDSKAQKMESSARFSVRMKKVQLETLAGKFRVDKLLQRISREEKSLSEKMATIRANDPQKALVRGFALVYKEDGSLIRSIGDVEANIKLRTHLADGTVVSEVISKEETHV